MSRKRRRFRMSAPDTFRLFHCARCQKQIRLCAECDRGQQFCAQPCRAEQRRSAQRRAGAAYQDSRRGRALHAARMQRYRERCRAKQANYSAQKVTHHTVTQGRLESRSAWSHAAESRGESHKDENEQKNSEHVGRCTNCRRALPNWSRRTRLVIGIARRRRSPRLPTGPPQ